jgi:hypothetical protein
MNLKPAWLSVSIVCKEMHFLGPGVDPKIL